MQLVWKLLRGKLLPKAVTMRIAVIFAILAVLYCVAADDVKKGSSKEESDSKNSGESGKKEGSSPQSSTTASPQRARRSPPRFDANQMKGKYAKSNKIKGLVAERSGRHERSIADYLSPTQALIYAAQPLAVMSNNQETTPSA